MRLKRLFYPTQEVRANPGFDRKGKLDGSNLGNEFEINIGQIAQGVIHASLTVKIDEEASTNAPYFFCFHIIGVFHCDEMELANAAELQLKMFTLLVGAVRERVADCTSRGPWSTFLMSPIPMPAFPETLDTGDSEAEQS